MMARKDRGPWREAKFHIIYGSICQITGEGKWAKTCLITKKWLKSVTPEEPLNYKELKGDRGLPNYLFDT